MNNDSPNNSNSLFSVDPINGLGESGTQDSGMCASFQPNANSTDDVGVTQPLTFKRVP